MHIHSHSIATPPNKYTTLRLQFFALDFIYPLNLLSFSDKRVIKPIGGPGHHFPPFHLDFFSKLPPLPPQHQKSKKKSSSSPLLSFQAPRPTLLPDIFTDGDVPHFIPLALLGITSSRRTEKVESYGGLVKVLGRGGNGKDTHDGF